MREGDLHRLLQRRDTHPAQTQAHQAVVQHAALVLQAELGALWREMGGQAAEGLSQLSRGRGPGSLQDPGSLPGGQSLRVGARGPRVMGDILPAAPYGLLLGLVTPLASRLLCLLTGRDGTRRNTSPEMGGGGCLRE